MIKRENKTENSQLSNVIKEHSEKFNFFAAISTIVGLPVAILTLWVTVCTLNTAASINNTINTTVSNNQIIQSGGPNIVQYVDSRPITITMLDPPRYEIVDYRFGTEEEARLLSLAKQYFDSGDYLTAFLMYSGEELRRNDYATINRAYCYAHGYGVVADVEIAMELYDSVTLDDARRNKLALMIATNSHGVYDSEILEGFAYFSSIKDYNVLNYLSLCKYGKSIDLISEENFEIELSDIYRYELVEEKIYSTMQPQELRPYEKFVSAGIVTGSSIGGTQYIYYIYQLYRLSNIDWLERVFG